MNSDFEPLIKQFTQQVENIIDAEIQRKLQLAVESLGVWSWGAPKPPRPKAQHAKPVRPKAKLPPPPKKVILPPQAKARPEDFARELREHFARPLPKQAKTQEDPKRQSRSQWLRESHQAEAQAKRAAPLSPLDEALRDQKRYQEKFDAIMQRARVKLTPAQRRDREKRRSQRRRDEAKAAMNAGVSAATVKDYADTLARLQQQAKKARRPR